MIRPIRSASVLCLLLPILLVLGLAGCGGSSSSNPTDNPNRAFQLRQLSTTSVSIGAGTISAWVMDSRAKRQEGMMFLSETDVRSDQGMLFVFPDSLVRSFWMRNTSIPLDIAYLDTSRKIVHVAPLIPFSEISVSSIYPAKYALEVKRGVLESLGAGIGTTLDFDPSLTASD